MTAGIKEKKGMVYFPAVKFMMGLPWGLFTPGNENPRHEVELSAFYLDEHGVTNAEYNAYLAMIRGQKKFKAVATTNPSPEGFDGPNQPVVNVSWFDADAYCKAQGKHLPTEAQWERAAWGLTKGYDARRKAGTRSGQINSQEAVYNTSQTANVCSKPRNDAGLCDMAGNTSQWVADWYDENYYKNSPTKDPTGPKAGVNKVLRGGSLYGFPPSLRATNRDGARPDYLWINTGFRCASSPEGS